jgi:hypothetical protein
LFINDWDLTAIQAWKSWQLHYHNVTHSTCSPHHRQISGNFLMAGSTHWFLDNALQEVTVWELSITQALHDIVKRGIILAPIQVNMTCGKTVKPSDTRVFVVWHLVVSLALSCSKNTCCAYFTLCCCWILLWWWVNWKMGVLCDTYEWFCYHCGGKCSTISSV